MSKEEVIALMESSKSEQEWNTNCDKVKASNHGSYPSWWYTTIITSGLLTKLTVQWATK